VKLPLTVFKIKVMNKTYYAGAITEVGVLLGQMLSLYVVRKKEIFVKGED